MISRLVINELKRKIPWILNTYGGIDNFISYIKEELKIDSEVTFKSLNNYQKNNLFNYLNLLIKYRNDIFLISPWNIFIDLRQEENNSNIINNNSININEPYSIFTLEGNLLYTVKSHLGVFGESRLDKNLILNSINTSAYFLKYKAYNGQEQIKLLLINLHSKNSTISNSNFRIQENIKTSNISIINNSGMSINIYYKEYPYTPNISTSILRTPENLSIIKNNDAKVFNINNSSYFLIDQLVSIYHDTITYPLNNIIFFPFNPQQPFFVGANTDISLLNKTFNSAISFSNKPLNDVIILKPYTTA